MKKTDFEPMQRLANAIIEQAVLDYLEAKHKLHTTNYKSKAIQTKKINQYTKWLIEVPYFFQSEYFKTLTNIDGTELLKMVEKKYILEVIESALKVTNYCASQKDCYSCVFHVNCDYGRHKCLFNTVPEDLISSLNNIYKEVKKNNGKDNTTNVQE